MNNFNYVVLVLLIFCFACSDDDAQEEVISIEQQVENFVTPRLIESLETLGFVFRDGEDTPNIEGHFLSSPVVLVGTNIPDDSSEIGDTFVDISFNFLAQSNGERTVDVEVFSGDNDIEIPTETFFSGRGDEFSVYMRSDVVFEGIDVSFIRAVSGIITQEGIRDMQQAILILEKSDDPDNVLIDVGEGRLFMDVDGLGERIARRSVQEQVENLAYELKRESLK